MDEWPLRTQGLGKKASERNPALIKIRPLSTTFGQRSNFLISGLSNSATKGAGAKRR